MVEVADHARRLGRQGNSGLAAETETPDVVQQVLRTHAETDLNGADVAALRQHVGHATERCTELWSLITRPKRLMRPLPQGITVSGRSVVVSRAAAR